MQPVECTPVALVSCAKDFFFVHVGETSWKLWRSEMLVRIFSMRTVDPRFNWRWLRPFHMFIHVLFKIFELVRWPVSHSFIHSVSPRSFIFLSWILSFIRSFIHPLIHSSFLQPLITFIGATHTDNSCHVLCFSSKDFSAGHWFRIVVTITFSRKCCPSTAGHYGYRNYRTYFRMYFG